MRQPPKISGISRSLKPAAEPVRFKQDLPANHAPSGRIVIVTLIAAFISGCGLLGPNEEVP